MLTTEDMTNVELFTELRDELSKAKGNMIYENDIPDCPAMRFKPNGITDNRTEYKLKKRVFDGMASKVITDSISELFKSDKHWFKWIQNRP